MDPNSRIGDYEILDELGRGGMGRVYRVRNVISDRIEAMKILLPDLVGRQDLAERFLREIKLLAAMNHPNIASLRTALTVDNQLIMIMEYVEGQSLAGRLRQGPIAIGDALSYLDQVLGALHYAHERDVIHRDIKPANMMLTPQGVVKLMDFGIARSGGESVLTVSEARRVRSAICHLSKSNVGQSMRAPTCTRSASLSMKSSPASGRSSPIVTTP
jgi:serine/threonine-protein kinase